MALEDITVAHIETASRIDDIDAALKPIADLADVAAGDVAGMVFSGFDWKVATVEERAAQIRHYINIEKLYAEDPQPGM